MRKFTLTALCVAVATQLFAQKIELSVQAGSALFHYAGKSATKQSTIIQGSPESLNYTNNPYGNNNGFSYGGGLQAQLISKGGFIAGLQGGYEVLRSKVDITGIAPPYNDFSYFTTANYPTIAITAKGSTYLKNDFINLSPYIGYRVSGPKIIIDLLPGIDLGFNVNSRDKGSATTIDGNNTKVNVDRKLDKAPTDVRIKFGVAAIYKRFGLTASYAHGLTNYEKKMTGYDYVAHSELMRFGMSYRIL